ncbi:14204_t:CDS:2 [Racocetra persica]|uniref:14204_t:CDS:1 n=1 Tax=Racocetra persica TaxID=160502 RepID=A0ACA9KJV6_9GLOM|nr:14204_t:CDS:2 [Racocetra persica]
MGAWAIAAVTVFSLGIFFNIIVENLTSPFQKKTRSNENEECRDDFDDQYGNNSTRDESDNSTRDEGNEGDYWTDLAEYMSIIEETTLLLAAAAFVFFSVVNEPPTPSCSMVPPQCNCSQDEDTDSDISDDYSDLDLGDIDYYFKDYDWSYESTDVHESK